MSRRKRASIALPGRMHGAGAGAAGAAADDTPAPLQPGWRRGAPGTGASRSDTASTAGAGAGSVPDALPSPSPSDAAAAGDKAAAAVAAAAAAAAASAAARAEAPPGRRATPPGHPATTPFPLRPAPASAVRPASAPVVRGSATPATLGLGRRRRTARRAEGGAVVPRRSATGSGTPVATAPAATPPPADRPPLTERGMRPRRRRPLTLPRLPAVEPITTARTRSIAPAGEYKGGATPSAAEGWGRGMDASRAGGRPRRRGDTAPPSATGGTPELLLLPLPLLLPSAPAVDASTGALPENGRGFSGGSRWCDKSDSGGTVDMWCWWWVIAAKTGRGRGKRQKRNDQANHEEGRCVDHRRRATPTPSRVHGSLRQRAVTAASIRHQVTLADRAQPDPTAASW